MWARVPLVGLAGIIPLALVVAVLVPAPRPLDFLMAPVQALLLINLFVPVYTVRAIG